ncbi:hypothetical protein Leryth_007979 [Lithospermum erythrorhizon]|nr:hypothetical protein Leryth_007979 [Lithospermum erythrorhizon]
MHKYQIVMSIFTFSYLVFVLLILNPSFIEAQEVEDEREFDYIKGSEKGPSRWGDLKKEWVACKNGKVQSPIDLSNKRVKIISRVVKRNYKSTNATITNRGHDILIKWKGDAGSTFVNGKEYFLKQAHWHSPSEHTIKGKRYDLELHLVHQSTNPKIDNNTSVFAALYKIGKPDSFLSKLMPSIKLLEDQEGMERHLEEIDPRELKIRNKKFYRYLGSLTVPPCTEGVIWSISKKVRTVSKDQVELLREVVHDSAKNNARPLQLIGTST